MGTESIWRILRGRAAVAAGAGLAALAALALLPGTDNGPGRASAAVDPADLTLSISDSPDPVATGAALTYSLKIHNAGPDPATATLVTNGLPSGVTFVSATVSGGDCDRTGTKVTCDLGTVTTTTDRTITIKTTVKKKSGEMTNSASVTSEVTDPTPANNLDSELTKISNPEPAKCSGRDVTILGTDGPDVLFGTAGDDVIVADEGDDLVIGFEGGDYVCGGPGTDVLRAGAGSDAVFGGDGSDFIRGRRGDDGLHGGDGRDRLRGGRGDDVINGDKGFDRCLGGLGLDALHDCERGR
jgi:uncharacterized repeat protein (TIGR01451 family)